MKINRQIIHLVLAGSLLFVFSIMTLHADEEADHAALRAMKTAYEEAVNSNNLSKIGPYLGAGVTGVMVTGEPVQGFQGLESYWKKIQALIGEGGSYHVQVNPDRSELFGDLAVAHGTTDDVVRLPSGKQLKFNSLWTAVCRRENGAWKVIRMQATMDPVNNVFTAWKMGTAKLLYGGGGFIAGGLLALVLMRLFRRARRPA